ncbi:MAG TPA: CocE/NonD family hydrolase [Steroidobacteraceae bacterium]|nr:CocE/NonD family hydrolase [Steroidobacteraceae bacterium]
MKKALLLLLFLAAMPAWAAPEFGFRPPATATDPKAGAIMSDLAARLIPVYQDPDPERYLANLSALQMAVGDYAAADISRQSLRERRRKSDFGHPVGRGLIYDLYAHAKALETQSRFTFAEALTTSFRDTIRHLNDHEAHAVTQWLGESPALYQESVQRAFDQQRSSDSIDQADAVELIWKYVAFDAYRTFGPLVVLLNAEDDHQRYTVDNEIVIQGPNGTNIPVVVIRPNSLSDPLPTLLEFRIDDSQSFAKDCAAHGYVGVVAYALGRQKSAAGFTPFQHDGEDARAVINWIAKQAWSDGRVGMYGEGYSGFVPWAAAAKKLPAALKAIATSAPSAPGINVPMEGNIPNNSAYAWSLEVSGAGSAESSNDDAAQWRALDQKWYRSGRRYRDMGRLFGKHNPIFIRWLNHPSYDGFWQQMVPYREQFAKINIPVLTMTGYFAASEPGALYYFAQHQRYNPHADHTLVIGPYDDAMMQRGTAAELHGYQVDAAALVDFRELRYKWFDHVFKGAATPALLTDSVNYQLMGSNEWQHAPSLDAMAGKSLRFYLDPVASGTNRRLTQHKKTNDAFVQQTVNFVDRTDAAWTPSAGFISRSLAPRHGTIFISEPLAKTTEFNGLFSGRLDFTVNKMDMDLNITLYELLANGDYVRLFSPTYEFRASYARDRTHRHILKAGERQELTFKSERMTSRQLKPGSRLVMVLSINKRPDREINYGTGGDVSEESIADGKIPLKIRWYSDSYIDIPVRR